jgi:hypothetical protein
VSTKTGSVTIDGVVLFRATYDPALRWNGWLGAPFFDRSEVARIAEWAKDDNTFEWDGEVLVHTEHHWRDEDPNHYEPEREGPDEHGRYCIGGFNWCWYETDPDVVPDAETVAVAREVVANINKHDTGTIGWAKGIIRRDRGIDPHANRKTN